MKQLAGLLRELRQRLNADFPDSAGMRRIALSLPASTALATEGGLLTWLSAQPIYPQFYWQHRDSKEEAAVCGAALTFSDASSAHQYLSQQGQGEIRIWGMNAFDCVQIAGKEQRSLLFLPRLELLRRGQEIAVTLTLASDTSLQQDAEKAKLMMDRLVNSVPLPKLQVTVTGARHLPEYEQWCGLLEEALASISSGQFDKVVMARETTLSLASPLPASAFMATSRAVNHHCYHFMLALSAEQAFLGSSPERLYHRNERLLSTEALAGTVASSPLDDKAQKLADWLMQDNKNQHENLLVVEDICQRLQGAVTGVDVMPAEILRLRKVQHLRRVIRSHLHVADDADCLQRLQPTAAVAGLPREPARQFILSHEPFHRGWYAGSAGYLSLLQTEFTVALRSALVEGQQVHLFAGAGIVAGSDPHQEWLEIENKAAGLRTLLEGESE